MKSHRFTGTIALAMAALSVIASRADDLYRLGGEIPIKGEGGSNLWVDPSSRCLFVSQAAGIVVWDLSKNQAAGEITNVSNAQSFAVVPQLKIAYTADQASSKLRTINLRTMKVVNGGGQKTGKNPRNIVFEPARMEIYTLNVGDNTVSRFEADDADFMGNISLPGKPSFAVADKKKGQLECAFEDNAEIATIDFKTHKVTNHWPIAPGESALTLALDEEHQRLFIACRNGILVVVDTADGKVAATVPIQKEPVFCAFDAATQMLVIADSGGTLNVLHEDSPDKLSSLQSLEIKQPIQAMALDSSTHNIYLATKDTTRAKVIYYALDPSHH